MAFDDLELEFEDEGEAKKKKSEAVQVDVDLEFNVPEGDVTKSRSSVRPIPISAGAAPAKVPSSERPAASVTKLEEVRAGQAKKPFNTSSPRVVGSSALQEDFQVGDQEVVEMREQMKRIEFESSVKVAIAEFKTDLLSELLSDVKLMQHQVEQLLVRIHSKHPDMKQEVLMIKKILADFASKKRK